MIGTLVKIARTYPEHFVHMLSDISEGKDRSLDSVCMSVSHDFGVKSDEDKNMMRHQVKEITIAIMKEIYYSKVVA